MPHLSHLPIPQPYIALFGSGNSIHNITAEDFERIKAQAFVITLNYAPLRLNGHLNMWSDRPVSEFLENHYSIKPKDCLFLAQEGRVGEKLKGKVDYWFNRKTENLQGNYTIVWALQLLKKYFPEKRILLFGVDLYAAGNERAKWYDQFTDYDRKKRSINYRAAPKLEQCGAEIAQFVTKENVYNCNPDSRLHHFEKKNWQDLFRLRILHLCPSALAGAPVHLSNILNKYTYCESKTILEKDFAQSKLQNLKWNYDIVRPSKKQLEESIAWADLIHYHRAVYPQLIPDKPVVLQFHSPPAGYIPGKTFAEFNGRKLVIAQYHPRFYTDALVVPNMIDIWEEAYLPGEKPVDKVTIFYSWASEIKNGWADKGSEATISILKRIQALYSGQVDVEIWNNRPYAACMAAKRKAHICIDECVTGSYHLQSLEGCSVGALTFNNLDDTTYSYLKTVSGCNAHPFVKSNLNGLFDALKFYINNRDALHIKGHESRKWMEEYWDPRKLVFKYIDAYFNVLFKGTVSPERDQKSMELNMNPAPAPMQKSFIPTSKSLSSISVTQNPKTEALNNVSQIGRSIKELYKKYEGQDIYIFGTGPSLFEVNPEDYKDKICFGINYAFEVMPYMDYIFVHVIENFEVIGKLVAHDKLVLSETLVKQHYDNPAMNFPPYRAATVSDHAYIYPIQEPLEKNIERKSLSLETSAKIFTWSTTTHSAIHVAAYMGAKNIYLVGVDYKLFADGAVHFNSTNYPEYKKQKWHALAKHKQGDLWLAKMLQKKGVNLINTSPYQKNTIAHASNIYTIQGNQKLGTNFGKLPLVKNQLGQLKNEAPNETLSICLTVQNRSKILLPEGKHLHLLPNCLRSVAQAVKEIKAVEIVISDYGSNDWPLAEWIGDVLDKIPYQIIQVHEPFDRGLGRNIAADYAKGNYLFFLDADMIVEKNTILKGLDLLKKGYTFFPVCFYFLDFEHTEGFWCNGKGNAFITKDMFNNLGKWPYLSNGSMDFDEDIAFFQKIIRNRVKYVEEREAAFFHQYHPGKSVDDILNKKRALITKHPSWTQF